MTTSARESESPVGSVDKALAIIEALAAAGPDGIALRDLVSETGLNKASAHRLLRALSHRGFADQDDAQHYRLGMRPVLLVEDYLRDENIPALFRPALVAVSREVQELVHLGVLDAHRVTYVDKVEPDRTIRVWSRIGRQAPASSTALGRAMVAAENTPDDRLDAFAAGAEPDSVVRFRHAVAAAKLNGYAIEQEENEAGIACVAVALRRATGAPVAVSITGPIARMNPERLAELGTRLRDVLSHDGPPGFALAPTP